MTVFKDAEFNVKNTQVRGGYVILIGEVEGTIRVGDQVRQIVDEVRTQCASTTLIIRFALSWLYCITVLSGP